mmetsp:Transcript_20417/g.54675  ORF Transcript_20417/g.54675 Transcript_20417/m.54675 type:complete len:278 (-) Transcript_20417:104-937(-)
MLKASEPTCRVLDPSSHSTSRELDSYCGQPSSSVNIWPSAPFLKRHRTQFAGFSNRITSLPCVSLKTLYPLFTADARCLGSKGVFSTERTLGSLMVTKFLSSVGAGLLLRTTSSTFSSSSSETSPKISRSSMELITSEDMTLRDSSRSSVAVLCLVMGAEEAISFSFSDPNKSFSSMSSPKGSSTSEPKRSLSSKASASVGAGDGAGDGALSFGSGDRASSAPFNVPGADAGAETEATTLVGAGSSSSSWSDGAPNNAISSSSSSAPSSRGSCTSAA